jgi:hypothetical protein
VAFEVVRYREVEDQRHAIEAANRHLRSATRLSGALIPSVGRMVEDFLLESHDPFIILSR